MKIDCRHAFSAEGKLQITYAVMAIQKKGGLMITVFNRKELLITQSMEVQARARDRLKDYGINYTIKVINRKSPSAFSDTRARTGTFGENLAMEYEYIIYVKKDDYDKALAAIHDTLGR